MTGGGNDILIPMDKEEIKQQLFNENIEEFPKMLCFMRKWLSEQDSLVRNYGDKFVENFLIRCENVNYCLIIMKNFLSYKRIFPEYFLASDPYDVDFRNFSSKILAAYIPKLTEDGCRVYFEKMTITDNETLFDGSKIIKYYCMQTEIRFIEDKYDKGDIVLFDCNHVDLLGFLTWTPFFIKSLLLILKAFPLNFKFLVLINTGAVMANSINFIKMMLPNQTQKKFYVYSDGTHNFLNHVSLSVLPKDYGGTQPSLIESRDKWLMKLDKYRDLFLEQGELIQSDFLQNLDNSTMEMYGYGGTFRNLTFD